MARFNDEVSSLLMDVQIKGSTTVDKRKLLWMMGKGQDRPSAWRDLLDLWEELGMERSDLHGYELRGYITLIAEEPGIATVEAWAGE
jgi:hypothetical protein